MEVFVSLDGSSARWSFRAPKELQNRSGNSGNMFSSEHAWETRQESEKIQKLSLGGSETNLQSTLKQGGTRNDNGAFRTLPCLYFASDALHPNVRESVDKRTSKTV